VGEEGTGRVGGKKAKSGEKRESIRVGKGEVVRVGESG
jgi:hypothetical protein